MKPLIVLILTFVLVAVIQKWVNGSIHWSTAGSYAFAAMLVFTSIGHFLFPQGMAAMIPEFVPQRTFLVYATGVLEIAFAVGLVFPQTRIWTGWALILFLIIVLPANIKGAVDHVNYQHPDQPGPGLVYLWFRIPLQVLFIGWVYCFAVRQLFHQPA